MDLPLLEDLSCFSTYNAPFDFIGVGQRCTANGRVQ